MNVTELKLQYDICKKADGGIPVIIVAAGLSSRMKGINKQFMPLLGIPVIARTLMAFEKNVDIAFSPECPKGGLPISCAKHAIATTVPISSISVPASSGWRRITSLATSLPRDIPTLATSRLCVRRLWTKILPGKGNTCVLFCSRRNGAEKMRRS